MLKNDISVITFTVEREEKHSYVLQIIIAYHCKITDKNYVCFIVLVPVLRFNEKLFSKLWSYHAGLAC